MRKQLAVLVVAAMAMLNACVTVGTRTETFRVTRQVPDTIRASSMSAEADTFTLEDLHPFDSPSDVTRILTEARFSEALKGFPCASEADRNALYANLRRARTAEAQDQVLQQFGSRHPTACPNVSITRTISISTLEPSIGDWRERTGSQYVNPASVRAFRVGGYSANEAQMRADARRLLSRNLSGEDQRMYRCILQSGLTEAQAREYLQKLASGQYELKPIPSYVRTNNACGGSPGEFIHLVQGPSENWRPLYAEVRLNDGAIVGAGAHCWNVTFVAQSPRVTVVMRRQQVQTSIGTRTVTQDSTREVPIRRFYCFASLDRGGLCAGIAGAVIWGATRSGGSGGNKTVGRAPEQP